MNWRNEKVAKKAKHSKKSSESTKEKKLKQEEKQEVVEQSLMENNWKVMEQELSQGIKEKKKLPEEQLNKLNNRIFKNMLLAIAIIVYLLLLNIGSLNIETPTYIMDLKVFSLLLIATTIIIFEISYKKDSGILCIYGIEILVLAILTLGLPTLYIIQKENYGFIITGAILTFTLYYMIKSYLIYRKQKKVHVKKVSDINEIIKKK